MAEHLTEASSAQAFAQADDTEPAQADLGNRRGWQYFDEKLTDLRVNDVENIIERGRILVEAHDELERGSYEAMVKRHFDLSHARKLRIIATHPVVSNRAHVHALPPSVFTLYELTKLPTAMLREKLQDGSINPRLERKDVAKWRQGTHDAVTVDGKAIEPRPSLAEQLKAAKTENERLKAKLERAGGSLFDLKTDGVKEIAEVIAATVPEGKASALANAIIAAIKERKRKRQAPAG
jgi:hypothetical protein